MEKFNAAGKFIELPNNKHAESNSWPENLLSLLEHQKEEWEFLKNNYVNLKNVVIREFEFDGFIVKVQYNPERMKSSAAAVDEESIKSRKCFLCAENLPEEQKGILFGKNLAILCNPYPIFKEHFTIAKTKHSPQLIAGNFDDLLNLSKDIGSHFTVFYNGPECGSSAPDHMHFQAGSRGMMPIEHEYDRIKGKPVVSDNKIEIFIADNYLRNFISLESAHRGELQYAFKTIVTAFKKIQKNKIEPMLNVIALFEKNKWRVIVFPRFKHRPSQFFSEGPDRILISPAAVDLGGVLIAPRREDFEKLNRDMIADIYNQVTIKKEFLEYFRKKIGEAYSVQEKL